MRSPSLVAFTRYAERRLAQRGLSRRQVADLVLSEHPRRRRNPREADWIVRGEGDGGGLQLAQPRGTRRLPWW